MIQWHFWVWYFQGIETKLLKLFKNFDTKIEKCILFEKIFVLALNTP